ncbi:unnamed protein product [Calypogeia fissa]
MAIGVGLDAIQGSSPALASSAPSLISSSKQCLGSNRIPSYTSVQRNRALQSSHPSFLNPSLLHLSSSSASAIKAKNYNYPSSSSSSSSSWRRGGRIGNLTSAKKCGQPHLKRNSLTVSALNCPSCSNARLLGLRQQQQRRDVSPSSNARNRSCILSSGFSSDDSRVPGGCNLQGAASARGSNLRPTGSRHSTIARCEAEGGAGNGVSVNERISTVDSGGGPAGDSPGDGADSYGSKPGSGIPERVGSDGDTAVVANGSSGEDKPVPSGSLEEVLQDAREEAGEESALDVLREILRVAQEDLESCRQNSERLEENAQKIAEEAIALKDEAKEAEHLTHAAITKVEELLLEEVRVAEEFEKATAAKGVAEELVKTAEAALEEALSKAKAEDNAAAERAEVDGNQEEEQQDTQREDGQEQVEFVEAKVEVTTERTVDITLTPSTDGDPSSDPESVGEKETTVAKTEVTVEGSTAEEAVARAAALMKEAEALESARTFLRDSEALSERIEAELVRVRGEKVGYELEVERLGAAADKAKEIALTADEDVAVAMAEAEQAVALELEAAQRVGDAEFALQKAVSFAENAAQQAAAFVAMEAEKLALSVGRTVEEIEEELEQRSVEAEAEQSKEEGSEKVQVDEDVGVKVNGVVETVHEEDAKPPMSPEFAAALAEKNAKEIEAESKKTEPVTEPPVPKASKKRSSRFFSASYFSSEDGEEFSPGKAYARFVTTIKPQLAKVVIGVALLFAGGAYMNIRLDRQALAPQPPAYTTSTDQVVDTKPIVAEFEKLKKRVVDLVNKVPHQEVNEEEATLFDVLWLLLASVIFVPLFMKIPGGSPVLGYLVAGVLIGPHTMHIIQNVHGTKAIAELGVVFLLFNIGLELSVERLSSMKKYVFGLGTAQVIATVAGVGLFLNFVPKIGGPPAIIIASGLALSSTAVVLQVLQERGESTSRHGRATFSVLLFQDLAVVVLLILIPLLSSNGGVGLQEIGSALGIAGIKAVVAIVGIIASGRLFLRPIYKQMADNHNAEIFAANTLLVVLGTSVLTARAGLSMALGAFLAGLLLAETEFALQVESDIAPYRGLLLGLFFMTVGMSIDPKLLVAKFPEIATALTLLIVGKTMLVAGVGRLFGLSPIAAVRAGLLLAPGGEFAFVAFGEAVNQGILNSQLSSLLFLVVGLSMALTPWLAAGGQLIAARFEQQDVRSLLPQENETDDLQGHIIICGFGRVGQIIAQLLSERLIPFVALDVRSDRVSVGRQLDLPVYFGDAGSKEVLHKVGAQRAAAAVITLDTPGANYRTVWALSKHFPGIKTFVRAHDVDHGINLEKAGATAVVPETLEPSLQLAAAVLAQAKVPAYEIASAIDEFRSRHLSELTELSETSGTSLGYGFSRVMTRPLIEALKMKTDEEGGNDKLAEGTIVAVP